MAQVCQITGKKPIVGHKVSHANKKTKRRFCINLHYKKFWLENEHRFIRLKVSTRGLRILDKIGLVKISSNI